MNISNHNSIAAFTSTGLGKLPGKPTSASRASSPDALVEPETAETQGNDGGNVIEHPAAIVPTISDSKAAEDQVVYLKNAMLALPALVLRGQGNLIPQAVAQLLH